MINRQQTIDAINHLVFKERQISYGVGTGRSKQCQAEIVKIHERYNTNELLRGFYQEIDRLARKYQRYNFVDHHQSILNAENI